ncbi:MAG: hypothetical protein JW834_01470 [Candidatus Diapherotrites archaeon]|nr:hypothetical protein [Candidatus Diapherotrites archaeon]
MPNKKESAAAPKKASVQRISTGIRGLDDLIDGGIPKGFSVLVSGPLGSYARLLALEFLYHGLENSEIGVYSSFEKNQHDLLDITSIVDWNLEQYMKTNQLRVQTTELFNFQKYAAEIEEMLFTQKPPRLVVDSVSFIAEFMDNPFKLRTALGELKRVLDKQECTAMLLCEGSEDRLSKTGIPEFTADGVIQTHVIQKSGQQIHALSIRTMNSTDYNTQIHPLSLTKKGLRIHKVPLIQ